MDGDRATVLSDVTDLDRDDGVNAYLETHRSQLVSFAERLVRFETQNPPGDTRDAVAWIESMVADTDIETERITRHPRKPNLLASIPGTTDRTPCFNGHLDTVPKDESGWTRSSCGEWVGDRLYGRGASDMKGAVAAMLQLAYAFDRSDTVPPVSLQFAFVSDEEVGGDAGTRAVAESSFFDPDACVVGETTCRADRYAVAVADRGHVWLTLEAGGMAAHGSRPMTGDNAIDRLVDAIAQFREVFGTRRLCLESPVEEIISESIEYYAPEMGPDAARSLFRQPTINLGTITGGTAINTVPARARAELDVRVTAGIDMRETVATIRECVANIGRVDVTELTWREGTYVAPNSPIAAASAAAAADIVNGRVYRPSTTGGSDASILRRHGIPAVEFGFGTDTAHGTDEYTTTQALERNVAAYAQIPYEYRRRIE